MYGGILGIKVKLENAFFFLFPKKANPYTSASFFNEIPKGSNPNSLMYEGILDKIV